MIEPSRGAPIWRLYEPETYLLTAYGIPPTPLAVLPVIGFLHGPSRDGWMC